MVEHALSCKKGGLVGQQHDDTRDEAGSLAAMALTKSRVSYKPYIFNGMGMWATVQEDGNLPASIGDESHGDVAVHGLWKKGDTCILDIYVTDTYAKTYASSSLKKVLKRAAKKKTYKYLDACLEMRRTFIPLAYSVDGMVYKEAKAFEKRVVSLLASKLRGQYSEMVGFVHARMSLAVVCSNTLLLCGARAGVALRPLLYDGAAFDALDSAMNDS